MINDSHHRHHHARLVLINLVQEPGNRHSHDWSFLIRSLFCRRKDFQPAPACLDSQEVSVGRGNFALNFFLCQALSFDGQKFNEFLV